MGLEGLEGFIDKHRMYCTVWYGIERYCKVTGCFGVFMDFVYRFLDLEKRELRTDI